MDLEHVSNRGNMQKTDRIFALDFKTAYIFTCMTRAIFKKWGRYRRRVVVEIIYRNKKRKRSATLFP